MMYHYRWDLDTDQYKASQFLMLSSNPAMPPEVLKERSEFIRARQTGRMDFVGAHTNHTHHIALILNRITTTLHTYYSAARCTTAQPGCLCWQRTIVMTGWVVWCVCGSLSNLRLPQARMR